LVVAADNDSVLENDPRMDVAKFQKDLSGEDCEKKGNNTGKNVSFATETTVYDMIAESSRQDRARDVTLFNVIKSSRPVLPEESNVTLMALLKSDGKSESTAKVGVGVIYQFSPL